MSPIMNELHASQMITGIFEFSPKKDNMEACSEYEPGMCRSTICCINEYLAIILFACLPSEYREVNNGSYKTCWLPSSKLELLALLGTFGAQLLYSSWSQ